MIPKLPPNSRITRHHYDMVTRGAGAHIDPAQYRAAKRVGDCAAQGAACGERSIECDQRFFDRIATVRPLAISLFDQLRTQSGLRAAAAARSEFLPVLQERRRFSRRRCAAEINLYAHCHGFWRRIGLDYVIRD